jgi:hypothetical protein
MIAKMHFARPAQRVQPIHSAATAGLCFLKPRLERKNVMENLRPILAVWTTILITAVIVGCSQAPAPQTTSISGQRYLLNEQPEGAKEVIAARETAQDGDDVVVVGRIGGSVDPWIADRAAFTIVDNSIEACSDIPGDKCKTPWDYCCRTAELPSATALVKIVDNGGELVSVDARELLGVKELDRIVVHGKAARDDEGNLTVLADGIYVTN